MPSFTRLDAAGLAGSDIALHWQVGARRFVAPHARLQVVAATVTALVTALPSDRMTLLDVGCGPATLRRLLPRVVDYYGADIAADVMPTDSAPGHFVRIDLNAHEEPFPGRHFDVVVCSGVFEYIRDPAAFLSLLSGKVRADGHLILTYLNRGHLRELRARLRGRPYAYPDPHLNFLSVPQTLRLLSRNRFRVEHSHAMSERHRALPGGRILWYPPLSALVRQFVLLCRRESAPTLHLGGG